MQFNIGNIAALKIQNRKICSTKDEEFLRRRCDIYRYENRFILNTRLGISVRGSGKANEGKQTLSCWIANIRNRAASDAIGWARYRGDQIQYCNQINKANGRGRSTG